MYGTASHGMGAFTVRAIPMPDSMTTFLQVNQAIISRLEREAQREGPDHQNYRDHAAVEGAEADTSLGDEEAAIAKGEILQRPNVRLEEFWDAFHEIAKAAGGEWGRRIDHVWAFGPNRVGPNMLLDYRPEGERWYAFFDIIKTLTETDICVGMIGGHVNVMNRLHQRRGSPYSMSQVWRQVSRSQLFKDHSVQNQCKGWRT